MRQRLPLLAVLLLACVAAAAISMRNKQERIVPLAPRVFLSFDPGRRPSILDARHTPKGIDAPPGGIVVLEGVLGLEVVSGKYVVGKTQQGVYFLMDLRHLGNDEPAEATVQRLPSETEWQEACRARGFEPPPLRRPSDF